MTANAPTRLSVLLVTYNHAEYVEEAINGVLMQDIDEPFEIVVADDGSTDETLTILRLAASNNPEIHFRFLDSSTNRGITRNYQRAFSACNGDYVAVLEGDDYWVRPSKLSEQRDFLDGHRECDLCSANYYVYDENRSQFTPRIAVGPGHVVFGARELIADNVVGNFSTCMYRVAALKRIPPAFYEIRSYDWAINICIGRYGLIGFLKEPMSVYRIHDRGAWSLLSHTAKLKIQLELIPAYDNLTDHVFHQDFVVLSEHLIEVIAERQGHPIPDEVLRPENRMTTASSLYPRALDLVPPIVIAIGRLIFPPAFRRYLAKLVFKG